jgi:glycosyltransferase involved in cell wall biosynthesis
LNNNVPLSVIIPVKNEASNIEKCLKHLQWADEIFVIDSQSTDGTIEIAERLGAQVVQFHFNGIYPKKKNWALQHLPFKNDWILIVDADEIISQDLQDEIKSVIKAPHADGYYLHFKYMFMGKPLRHCYSRTWILRLFKHKIGRYEKMPVKQGSKTGDNEAHEHIILKGTSMRLKNDVLHYAYPTIYSWVEKHNRYSNWEAELYNDFISGKYRDGEKYLSFSVQFKRKIKSIYLRLPFRYLLRFLHAYFYRFGFLDGKPGFIFCSLLCFYDFLSWAKVYEIKQYTKLQSSEQKNEVANTLIFEGK